MENPHTVSDLQLMAAEVNVHQAVVSQDLNFVALLDLPPAVAALTENVNALIANVDALTSSVAVRTTNVDVASSSAAVLTANLANVLVDIANMRNDVHTLTNIMSPLRTECVCEQTSSTIRPVPRISDLSMPPAVLLFPITL